MFLGSHPCKISGSLSFQESTVISFTSPASPEMNLALILFLFLKRSSHPFDALNSNGATSKALAICMAFSCSIGPDIGMYVLASRFTKPCQQCAIKFSILPSSRPFCVAARISLES